MAIISRSVIAFFKLWNCAKMMANNTLSNGLWVHPMYVNRTNEDGSIE